MTGGRPTRVGLVGTGSWATQVHGPSAVAHPGIELVGVWGRNEARTASAAAVLGVQASTSLRQLAGQVDVLTFAVPPQVQAGLVAEVAAEVSGLLLEKPTGLDVQQARAVVDATAHARTAVLLTARWAPPTREWLADLSSRGGWESGRASLVNALTPQRLADSPWRAARGALWDVGPHALSVLEAVLGPVTGVQATRSVSGLVQLLLTHDGGATSSAELSLTADPAASHTEVSFWGAGGRSGPAPRLTADDVRAAHGRALDALLPGSGTTGPDAAYGLHLTEVLAEAESRLDRGRGRVS